MVVLLWEYGEVPKKFIRAFWETGAAVSEPDRREPIGIPSTNLVADLAADFAGSSILQVGERLNLIIILYLLNALDATENSILGILLTETQEANNWRPKQVRCATGNLLVVLEHLFHTHQIIPCLIYLRLRSGDRSALSSVEGEIR